VSFFFSTRINSAFKKTRGNKFAGVASHKTNQGRFSPITER
jgi:hypothetical protein